MATDLPGDPGAIYVDESGPCSWCGVPTNRISIGFEALTCLKCDSKAWAGYWKALGNDGTREGG